MKFIISFLSIILFASINSFAETTENDGYEPDVETAETASACVLRVKKPGYNVRRKPTSRGREKRRGVCGGTLRSSGLSSAPPLGIIGNWIKLAHPSCPNQTAYVYYKAFEPSDLAAFRSGRCQMSSNYGYRKAPPAPTPIKNTNVSSKGSSGHQFPMNACQGIRNDDYGSGKYGASRAGGRRTHGGCDYKAPLGSPLKSPCTGSITYSGWPPGKNGRPSITGNLVIIKCDNGDKFKLMHLLNGSLIKGGSRVGPGSYVGKVGKTGNANVRSMQTHLHIEFKRRGVPIDPASLWSCR